MRAEAAGLALVFLLACGGGEADEPASSASPSSALNGMTGTVASANDDGPVGSTIDLDPVARLEIEELWRIGSVQDPNEGFSRIAQVTVDDQGLIYVFEEADSEIRVYGPQGDRLRTIGRHGLGPGEFQGAVHLFGVQRETVWAIEFFAQSGARYKMTLFHRDGSHVESFVFPPVEARLTPAFALRQRPSRPKAR